MTLSRNWLNEFTQVNVSDKEFCDRMTMSGSKVEGVELLGSEITNVVVGKVKKGFCRAENVEDVTFDGVKLR